MKYKIFTNDVGPSGYSCLSVVEAKSDHAALVKAVEIARPYAPVKVLAVPVVRLDEAFVRGSNISPTGLRLRRGAFLQWGAKIQ